MIVLKAWIPSPTSFTDSFFHLMSRGDQYSSSLTEDLSVILSTFSTLSKPLTLEVTSFHDHHEQRELAKSVRATQANSKRRSFGLVTREVTDSGVIDYVRLI